MPDSAAASTPADAAAAAEAARAAGFSLEELEHLEQSQQQHHDGGHGHNGPVSKDLPLDMMWSSACSSLVRQFAAAASAVRSAVDALATLLSLVPHAEQMAATKPSLAPTAAAKAIYALVSALYSTPVQAVSSGVVSTSSVVAVTGSLCALRVLPSTAFAPDAAAAATAAHGHAHSLLTCISAEAMTALLAVASRHALHQLGEVCDVLRTQAAVNMLSAALFLPSAVFGDSDEAVVLAVTPLIASLGAVLLSHDSAPLLTLATPAEAAAKAAAASLAPAAAEPAVAYGATTAEEAEAVTGALLHLLKRPEYKRLHDAAWTQLHAAAKAPGAATAAAAAEAGCPLVAASLQAEPALLTLLASILTAPKLSCVTSDLRTHCAGALAVYATSPAAGGETVAGVTTAMLAGLSLAAASHSQAATLAVSAMDLELVHEIVMGLIDMYSEDDRYVEEYKAGNVTRTLALFAPVYATALKDLKKRVVEVNKRRNAAGGSEEAAAAAALVEKTAEGVENVQGFVGYKKSMKL